MRWAISLWACQTDPWRGMSLQSRGGLWLPLTKPPLEKQIYPTTQATSLSESHAYPWKNNTLLLRWAPRRMSDVLATAELAFSHSRQHLGLVFTRLTSIWRHWWKWSSHFTQLSSASFTSKPWLWPRTAVSFCVVFILLICTCSLSQLFVCMCYYQHLLAIKSYCHSCLWLSVIVHSLQI